MAKEDNLRDLQNHADDFRRRRGFTHTVLDRAGAVIGCVYIYPPGRPGSDADVRSRVRGDHRHLDRRLHDAVSRWLRTAWPFAAVHYAERAAEPGEVSLVDTALGHASAAAGENTEMLHWKTDMYLEVDGTDFALAPADALVMQTAIDSGALLLRKPRRMVEQYDAMRSEIDPTNVLELGIYNGGSTALLALLFRPRRLVAIDITPSRAPALDDFIDDKGLHDVVHPYFGVDQGDRALLEKIVADEFGTEPLDLVIDDASHLLPETTASFNALFPRLRPGGLFVLEDWSWQHPRDEDVVGFLLRDEQASQELARRLQAGDVAPPVSRLVLELVLTAAYAPEIVDEVTSVRRGFLVVRRGDAALDPNEFDITQRYGARGRSMLT
jgi:predicted O-methyltransferase YrrM